MSEFDTRTQFFFENKVGELATLSDEDSHHALRVLRMKAGDKAVLPCDSGWTFLGELISEAAPARFRILSKQPAPKQKYLIHLYIPNLAPKKLDGITRAAVELWVHEVYIVDFDMSEKTRANIPRLEKILRSAACQSGLCYVPRLHLVSLSDVDYSRLSFYACPHTKNQVRKTLDTYVAQDVNVFTGPEKGFSAAEKKFFATQAVIAINLAPGVLRTQTAPITAISAIRALWNSRD